MRLYNKGSSLVRVEVSLTHAPLELGKVNVNIMVRSGLSFECIVDNMVRRGFELEVSYEPLGIAYLTGSFPSMGLVTATAERIERIVEESMGKCPG
jgi:hypothetical protein